MDTFSVKNFERFQHYKDRDPPWIKLYNSTLDDYAFGCLQDASKLHLIAIWLLASRTGNKIPYDPVWIASRINATDYVDLAVLEAAGFIQRNQPLHNVAQDASTPLADCYQVASPRALARGETETETERVGEVSAREANRLMLEKEFNLVFWPAYPVKNGRKEALKAFHAARAKVPLTTIMGGLQRYLTILRAPNAPQAKYAQGWLNGERWADENVPTLNGAAHDGRNGTKAGGKLSPGDATFAGFAIALEQFSERERTETARDSGKGGDTPEPLLDASRRSARARPNGG